MQPTWPCRLLSVDPRGSRVHQITLEPDFKVPNVYILIDHLFNRSMGICASLGIEDKMGLGTDLSTSSILKGGVRKVHIPIPEHLEDWQRLEEPLLHKTLHFLDKSSIKSLEIFRKSYGQDDAGHTEDLDTHRKKHGWSVEKTLEKNGLKQWAKLFRGMSEGDAARFAQKGLTYDKRGELHMKAEHYNKILKILHVSNAPAHKHGRGHTAKAELEELLAIVGVAEKVHHAPLPTADLARVSKFLWVHRDVFRDENYFMVREIKFDQSIFISTKFLEPYPDSALNHMFKFFEECDIFKNGYITHEDLFDNFEKSDPMYCDSVFVHCLTHDYGSIEKPGFLDIKEFCSLIETVCLMNKEELLHFTFHELQYKQAPLESGELHPYINVGDITTRLSSMKRAEKNHGTSKSKGGDVNYDLLKEMRHFLELKKNGHRGGSLKGEYNELLDANKLYFEDWAQLAHDTPSIYHGANVMQQILQKKTGLGIKFWLNRRKKLTPEFDVCHEHELILQAKLEAAANSRDCDIGRSKGRSGYKKGRKGKGKGKTASRYHVASDEGESGKHKHGHEHGH